MWSRCWRNQGEGAACRVMYAKGCDINWGAGGTPMRPGWPVSQTRSFLAVGESAEMSGEAAVRSSLDLPGRQMDLVRAVHESGKPTSSS